MPEMSLHAITTYATGIAVFIGVLGSVIPLLPGVGLQLLAIIVWAVVLRELPAYAVVAWAIAVIVAGTWWQWRHPSTRSGIPDTRMLLSCGLGAIIGGMVLPVAGFVVGLCVGAVLNLRLRGTPWGQAVQGVPAALKLLLRYKLSELVQAISIAVAWEIAVLVIFQGKIV